MSFDDNPGFKKLVDAFTRFAVKHDPNQLKPKLIDIASQTAKSAIDEVERAFPTDAIERFVEDVYEMITGQDVTDGLAEFVQSLDLQQVEDGLNAAVTRLKDPQVSKAIAGAFKNISGQASFTEFKTQMKFMLGNDKMHPTVEVFFDKMMDDLELFYDASKDMSVEEVAEAISDYADQVPTDFLSQQIYGMMQHINPETLTMMVNQLAVNLPSARKAADMYELGLGEARHKVDQLADKFSAPSQPKQAQPKPDAEQNNKPQPKGPKPKQKNDDGFKF